MGLEGGGELGRGVEGSWGMGLEGEEYKGLGRGVREEEVS